MKLVESKEVENVKCSKVTESQAKKLVQKEIPELIKLIETLHTDKMTCCGIAAPQVGIKKNFFVKSNNREPEVFFNASYTAKPQTKMIKSLERCFSYPGKKEVKVERYKRIKIVAEKWNSVTNKLEKTSFKIDFLNGVIFQHEIDHINGVTIYGKKE